jgi:hypothetical protein
MSMGDLTHLAAVGPLGQSSYKPYSLTPSPDDSLYTIGTCLKKDQKAPG